MTETTSRGGQLATNMTVGDPKKLIILFSIPLLIGNIFQQLYNMVDSVVVGNYVGKIALAAVGSCFPIIYLLSSIFIGISTGSTIMISQFYGAQNLKEVKETVNTVYTSMMVGAIPLTLVGILCSGWVLQLTQVPPDTFDAARTYLVIIFVGLIGNLGYNVNTGIMQGLGDSKTPLIFLVIACAINIVLDLVFVIVFHMGVAGVALATIIAQAASWLFGIVYINKKYPFLHIQPFKLSFHKELFTQTMRLGIPSSIQSALFSVGVLAIQSLVNSGGSDFMAGFNGANKLDTFAFMPIDSFSRAVTTYVGQNIGAGKLDRVKSGTRAALGMSAVVAVALGAFVLATGRYMMMMFSQEPAVIDAGVAYLNRILPFYLILAALFVLNGVMRGAGETLVPMFSSIISLWLARVPAAYILNHFFGKENIFYCYAIGWVFGVSISLYFYLKGDWKNKGITMASQRE